MSLKLGKRSLFEDEPDYVSLPLFHTFRRPFGIASAIENDSEFIPNVSFLRKQFPQIDVTAIEAALEDSENNLELAFEILTKKCKKDKMQHADDQEESKSPNPYAHRTPNPTALREMTLLSTASGSKKTISLPDSHQKEARAGNMKDEKDTTESPLKESRTTSQQEEVPEPVEIDLEKLTKFLVDSVFTAPSYEAASEGTMKTLHVAIEPTRVRESMGLAKLQQDNTILKRAFLKQYYKGQDANQEILESKVKVANLEMEARSLREQNFQLLLRIIASESPIEELRNMHIC